MTREEMAGLLTALKLAVPRWAPPEINHELAGIYLGALQDFDGITIAKAISRAMQNLTEWPPPAKLKRMCQGTDQDDTEIGSEVASRIEGAISTCGHTGWDRAKEKIGEIGVRVVDVCGGWQEICNVSYDQLPSARKNWRDLATQLSRKLYNDNRVEAPALPKSNQLQDALRIAQGLDS